MRKKVCNDMKRILCFLLLVCCLCSACAGKAPEALEVELYPQADYWAVLDLSETAFPTEEACEELVEGYLVEIADLLCMEGWWMEANPDAKVLELNLQIGAMEQSMNFGVVTKSREDSVTGSVLLSTKVAANGTPDAALAHELTHMMGFMNENNFSHSLMEGICQYVQAEVGYDPYPMPWSFQEYTAFMVQADNANAEAKEKIAQVAAKAGAVKDGYPYGQSVELNVWYTLSHSFVRYLIDEYGIEKVRDLILEGVDESSYAAYLGKPLSELRDEWMNYLLTMETPVTGEKLLEYAKELEKQ